MRICVVGGTGLLGAPVARALAAEGHSVVIVARKDAALPAGDLRLVRADARDLTAMRAALDGCDAVHISLQGGPRPEDFVAVEAGGTSTIVKAAAEAGVGRITLISGLSVALMEAKEGAGDRVPASVAAKRRAELLLLESGIPCRVLRPSNVSEGLERSMAGRWALAPRERSMRSHWLSAVELGEWIARDLVSGNRSSTISSVLGPDALTIPEALALWGHILHPGLRVVSVPVPLLGLLATISRNPALRAGVEMLRFSRRLDESSPTIVGRDPIRLRRGIVECAQALKRPTPTLDVARPITVA